MRANWYIQPLLLHRCGQGSRYAFSLAFDISSAKPKLRLPEQVNALIMHGLLRWSLISSTTSVMNAQWSVHREGHRGPRYWAGEERGMGYFTYFVVVQKAKLHYHIHVKVSSEDSCAKYFIYHHSTPVSADFMKGLYITHTWYGIFPYIISMLLFFFVFCLFVFESFDKSGLWGWLLQSVECWYKTTIHDVIACVDHNELLIQFYI
jgi:hypothetical protein